MRCVQQAVLEFDEAVQGPWRPLLVSVSGDGETSPAHPSRPRSSRQSPSRVGACRPGPRPAGMTQRTASGASSPVKGGGCARPVTSRRRARLTARGRRLVAVLVLVGSLGLATAAGLLDGGSGDLRLAGESSVVVESGDTLWSIATAVAGTDDVRVVVDRIRQLNGLQSADLVPGQVLRLP